MSIADKAFASGLSTAAQIARRAAVSIQKTQTGAKWQGACAALAALADDLDELAGPLPPAMQAKTQGYTGDECQECGS